MSSSASDEISITLPRPRGGRAVAALLALVVAALWSIIVGVVIDEGVAAAVEGGALAAIALVTAICVALSLVAWRYAAVAFGPRGRLAVRGDGMWLDAPALLAESPRWHRAAIRYLAIDEGSAEAGAGRFPVLAAPAWAVAAPEDDLAAGYLFTRRDGAVFPLVALGTGRPNLAIVFHAPQAAFRLRLMSRLVIRRRGAARLGRPAHGVLLEVADPGAARRALAGWVTDAPLMAPRAEFLDAPAPPRGERPARAASEPPTSPLALALVAGACLLPLILGLALVGAAAWEWRSGHVSLIGIVVALLGEFILIAMIPRRTPEPPGGELTRDRQPALFALIDRVATALGEEPFDRVVTDLSPNAGATVVGLRRRSRRRFLTLGLPLATTLTRDELGAVIAREMAHLRGPREGLNRVALRALDGLQRTVRGLEDDRFTTLPARLLARYADLVESHVPALRRERELAADAAGVRVAGAAATAGAVRAAARVDAAFPDYWRRDVAPILRSGRRPPIADGLRRYLSRPMVRRELAALGPIDADETPPRAAGVRDDDDLERALLAAIADDDRATALRRIAWSQVGEDIVLPALRLTAARVSPALVSTRVGALGDPWGVAGRLHLERDSGADGAVIASLGAALCVALADAGWTANAEPGDELVMSRGDVAIRPFVEVAALIEGRPGAAEHWGERSVALGIGHLPLGNRSSDRSGSQANGG